MSSRVSERLAVACAGWPVPGPLSLESEPGDIVVFSRCAQNGRLGAEVQVAALPAPSYLAVHPNGRTLYATTDRTRDQDGGGEQTPAPGSVTAFGIGPDRTLSYLNARSTSGPCPCHVSVHPDGGHVIVADYVTGRLSVLPLRADGSLGALSLVVQREGSGRDPVRQEGPHAHMAQSSPDGRWVLVADLGTDEIASYSFSEASGSLQLVRSTMVGPGRGPRHFVFHPSGLVFVANELDASVTILRWDPASGGLNPVGEVSLCDRPRPGAEDAPAGLVLSPDNRFLYVAHRGPNVIAGFRIVGDDLTPIGDSSSAGEPREMTFVDRYLYVANYMSDNLAVFVHDGETGALGEPIQVLQVPGPASIMSL